MLPSSSPPPPSGTLTAEIVWSPRMRCASGPAPGRLLPCCARTARCRASIGSGSSTGDAVPVVEGKKKRRLLDAVPSPPAAEDGFTFEELALAAGVALEAAVLTSQSAGGVTTDMIWHELLEEEQAQIDVEVEDLVAAAASTEEEMEPWEGMGEEEVQDLMQQIDCLAGSPSS